MPKNTNKFLEGDIVREFFEYLLKKFPVKEPVVLVMRKNLKNYGYYSFNGDAHYIFINSSECEGCQIESGLHEASHLLDYKEIMKSGKEDNKDPHSDSWGKWYSRVYRTYLEFIDLKGRE